MKTIGTVVDVGTIEHGCRQKMDMEPPEINESPKTAAMDLHMVALESMKIGYRRRCQSTIDGHPNMLGQVW